MPSLSRQSTRVLISLPTAGSPNVDPFAILIQSPADGLVDAEYDDDKKDPTTAAKHKETLKNVITESSTHVTGEIDKMIAEIKAAAENPAKYRLVLGRCLHALKTSTALRSELTGFRKLAVDRFVAIKKLYNKVMADLSKSPKVR